jgi:hypothetical protein
MTELLTYCTIFSPYPKYGFRYYRHASNVQYIALQIVIYNHYNYMFRPPEPSSGCVKDFSKSTILTQHITQLSANSAIERSFTTRIQSANPTPDTKNNLHKSQLKIPGLQGPLICTAFYKKQTTTEYVSNTNTS